MSATSAKGAPAKLRVLHYQALCGLALAAILLVQFQRSSNAVVAPAIGLFLHMMTLLVGVVGILYRLRLSPMFMLLAFAAPQVVEHYYVNPGIGGPGFLDVADMLLGMAGLTFFIGYYRLYGLRFGVLPADPRQDRSPPAPPMVRSEATLTSGELTQMIFIVPIFALLAEVGGLLLYQRWRVIDLPGRWQQVVLAAWVLLVAITLAAQVFSYWRRLQMDRSTALLMLHDMVWQETRGEQRRIQRWLAWKKLRQKKQEGDAR